MPGRDRSVEADGFILVLCFKRSSEGEEEIGKSTQVIPLPSGDESVR